MIGGIMSEDKPVCARCGSSCVISVSNQLHCNQCQFDWGLDRFPIVTAARKRKEAGWVGGWARETTK